MSSRLTTASRRSCDSRDGAARRGSACAVPRAEIMRPSSPSLSTSSSRRTFAYCEPLPPPEAPPPLSRMKIEPHKACEQARSSSGASSRPARAHSATVERKSATDASPVSSTASSVSAVPSLSPGTACATAWATKDRGREAELSGVQSPAPVPLGRAPNAPSAVSRVGGEVGDGGGGVNPSSPILHAVPSSGPSALSGGAGIGGGGRRMSSVSPGGSGDGGGTVGGGLERGRVTRLGRGGGGGGTDSPSVGTPAGLRCGILGYTDVGTNVAVDADEPPLPPDAGAVNAPGA
eukprot:scaffold34836_cov129-Isochrysis_galbana.AAC.3